MLIEFNISNFRAFRDPQRFSLARAKGRELENSNVFRTSPPNEFGLLRSAAVYGPNGSGKTTFIQAASTMRKIVVESAAASQHGDKLPVAPFLFSKVTSGQPTEFEMIFLVDSVRYQYGFSVTEERVHDEWLFAFPKGYSQRWFERHWLPEEKQHAWYLGDNLEGEKKVWQKATRENALFLSTAVNLNSQQLQPIFNWFRNSLRVANVTGWGPEFTAMQCERGLKDSILEFLRAADLAIEDILVEKEPFDSKSLPDDMPDALKQSIASEMKDVQFFDLKTVHRSVDGDEVILDFEHESAGTQKIFAVAGPWLDSLENGYVLFIDELNNSLHPRLVKFLVGLFNDPERNPNNAQLVFTTHETSMLNQEVLRRDQIWFCERDKEQAAKIYPLTDFKPRKGQNRENLELAYLSGRYGALPFVRKYRESA